MPYIIRIINIVSGIALIMMGTFCILFSKENKQKTADILVNVRDKIDDLFLSRDNVHHRD